MFKKIKVLHDGTEYKQIFEERLIFVPRRGEYIILEGMNRPVMIETIIFDYNDGGFIAINYFN